MFIARNLALPKGCDSEFWRFIKTYYGGDKITLGNVLVYLIPISAIIFVTTLAGWAIY
ncbi:hypothetical protein IIC38_13775 [candidate division KSB1 bacterium]|nr:hypothetical protein [candidate division KSB1 bacterium]